MDNDKQQLGSFGKLEEAILQMIKEFSGIKKEKESLKHKITLLEKDLKEVQKNNKKICHELESLKGFKKENKILKDEKASMCSKIEHMLDNIKQLTVQLE